MEENLEEKQPKLLLAILLSFVMGLVGSVLYIILYCIGFIAWVAGIVIVVAAGWGYKKFNLKMDTKGYIIVSIISIIDIVIALLVGISASLSIELGVSFSQSLVLFMEVAAEEPEVKSALIYDIVLSLVCIVIGIFVFVANEKRAARELIKKQEEKKRAEQALASETEVSDVSDVSNTTQDETEDDETDCDDESDEGDEDDDNDGDDDEEYNVLDKN